MTYIKKALLAAILLATPLLAQVKGDIEVPYIAYEVKGTMDKGFSETNANCLTCHSFGYVINQGRQSRAFWKGKVQKMRVHFKAPITDDDAKVITDYLAKHYGNGH